MIDKPSYISYAQDEVHMARYQAYQARYATKMRESDRLLIDWIRETVGSGAEGASLLDVGCSTGNLLVHLRHWLPGLRLTGADLSSATIAANRTNVDLAGLDFQVADIVQQVPEGTHDIVTCNAIFAVLDDSQFSKALKSIRASVKPGGHLLGFDWFHAHDDQHLSIVERSREFPDGLRIWIRPRNMVRNQLLAAGFDAVEFRPFQMPFDLPGRTDPADVTSFTRATTDGERLSFRGALYQPWCHFRAHAR